MAKKKTRSKKSTRKSTRPAKGTPKTRSCACVHVHYMLMDRYPEFRTNQSNIEAHTSFCMQMGEAAFRHGIPTIPVIVHVVYRTSSENISDAQIKSQIDVLNRDFRAKNSDVSKVPRAFKHLVGDARMRFKLEDVTRTKTTRTSFGPDDSVKSSQTGGIEPIDTANVLNIWACTLGGGLLGYAQFPGGPPDTDGVVVLNTAFGSKGSAAAPFNKGRTATHEVGHYFNLSHIWGESRFATCSDDDFVADTPMQLGPNTGKPRFPSVSCNNGPHGDLFMNYMDYVDDAAMFMFSKGQVGRMQAALTGPRASLGT